MKSNLDLSQVLMLPSSQLQELLTIKRRLEAIGSFHPASASSTSQVQGKRRGHHPSAEEKARISKKLKAVWKARRAAQAASAKA